MSNDLHDFEKFLAQREDASRAWVNGDAKLLKRISTDESPATFLGPKGGLEEGARHVSSVYEQDAGRFESGETTFEVVHMEASGGLAFFTGIQHAKVVMKGEQTAQPMSLRVTEVFRREGPDWKLVHRHADPLAAKPEEAEKPEGAASKGR